MAHDPAHLQYEREVSEYSAAPEGQIKTTSYSQLSHEERADKVK